MTATRDRARKLSAPEWRTHQILLRPFGAQPSRRPASAAASLCYFFFFAAARGFAAGLASGVGAGGLSPITPLSGQILNAGHFWQPATMAIGQSVMGISLECLKVRASMRAAGTRK